MISRFRSKVRFRHSMARTCQLGIERLEDRRVLSADFGSAFAVGPGANGYDISKDAAGNTLVLGMLTTPGGATGLTVDVDPGPGTANLTQIPGGENLFVVKYDSVGNFQWVTRMGGGIGNSFGPRLAVAADGAVLVAGNFSNTTTFGSTTLVSQGNEDPFVAKLDASGNILWANRLTSSSGSEYANAVAIDSAGNAFVIGDIPSNASDTFITKLDPAGTQIWTKQFGRSSSGRNGGWARGYEITVDSVGNVYATGRQGGTVDFDAGPGVTSSAGEGFVLKMTGGGSVVWAKSFAKQGSLGTTEPQGIAVDGAGNVYTAGTFWAGMDFDPGKSKYTLTSNGGYALYISKLDAAGNFAWAKMAGGPSDDFARGLALDAAANVYVTGTFGGTVDFDPSAGVYNLTSAGAGDIVVWKLTSSGSFDWAAGMGGTGGDEGRGIAVDGSGNVFTTGGIAAGPADFDPSPTSTYTLTGLALFVSKLTQTAPLAMALTAEPQTATTTEREVSSPPIVPTGSSDPTSQPTAPGQLLMPTKPSAKSNSADAALAQADENWLDSVLEDDLLLDLVAAR